MSSNRRVRLPDPLEQPTLTVEETAAILQLGRNTVYDAVHSGAIPSIHVGRRYLVPTARIAAMLGIGDLTDDDASGSLAPPAEPPQSQPPRRALPA